jgi:hypothetical protein
MKIHTTASVQLLKEIEENSNVVWASGSKPIITNEKHMSTYIQKFLGLNFYGDNEITSSNYIINTDSELVTPEEFLAECIRIAPKKEEKP